MNPATSSPWLAQLQHERPHFVLDHDASTDVVIVGAGIAGVATAYELLKLTKHTVLLIDAGRIAHGATGRNAGQVVSYFERPLSDIAKEFGVEMAVKGQELVESAWGQLEDIIADCTLQTPFYPTLGYAGFSTMEQVITALEEKDMRAQMGLLDDPLMLKVGDDLLHRIPLHLLPYVMEVPHSTIMRVLETDDRSFIAAAVSKKGCVNSAQLCEELVGWMTKAHPNRFAVAEHLPVETVILAKDSATLKTAGPTITAKSVVLCTNGFENLTINNTAGPDIDVAFHAAVHGCIGYMAGYIDESKQGAAAVSYYQKGGYQDAYHYLTRRPYQHHQTQQSLICIGGPERQMPDRASYDPSVPFPADIEEELSRVLHSTYRDLPPAATRAFLWQGLMGYTPNGIRRIGFEPKNHTLLYNLGCNGVGILPSIYGGKRIAQLLAGIHLEKTMFDPVE